VQGWGGQWLFWDRQPSSAGAPVTYHQNQVWSSFGTLAIRNVQILFLISYNHNHIWTQETLLMSLFSNHESVLLCTSHHKRSSPSQNCCPTLSQINKSLAYGYVHDRDVSMGKMTWEIIDLSERSTFHSTSHRYRKHWSWMNALCDVDWPHNW
jgi:hypothetical protein